ncbi:MAG: AAA family ATPase [Lachnospiraceae bacterium]|nr:AAA family ATPase [Lachnospiraceae bacterium]
MAKVIGIMGESGSGKTTSMRELDPGSTFYIDCDKKGLSWKGWKNQYSFDKHNYMATDQIGTVAQLLDKISSQENMKHIKVVVIDTLNGLMVADEVRRMKEKGFDKWQDLAQCVWELLDSLYTLRDDLTVIVVCHSQTQKEDDGYTFTRIKTSGKKLDKLSIETKLTTVLYAVAKDGEYVFKTHANNSTAKTPLGAFEADEIPNNIVDVLKALEDY